MCVSLAGLFIRQTSLQHCKSPLWDPNNMPIAFVGVSARMLHICLMYEKKCAFIIWSLYLCICAGKNVKIYTQTIRLVNKVACIHTFTKHTCLSDYSSFAFVSLNACHSHTQTCIRWCSSSTTITYPVFYTDHICCAGWRDNGGDQNCTIREYTKYSTIWNNILSLKLKNKFERIEDLITENNLWHVKEVTFNIL